MRFLLSLLLLLPFASLAQPKEGASQTPAQANKQLFDRTIDELNFRTFETVYDKHFTRQKYPENLRTAAARRAFANFENNAELQKLFLNYNGVAERYKTHFGNGPLTLAEFQKQLNGVLRDRNFEFFIRGLPRDEKQGLIRTEERIIKQAVARFNASAEPVGPTPAPTSEAEEPLAASAPLTTNGLATSEPAAASSPDASSDGAQLRSPAAEDPTPSSGGPGWVGYLTLLSSLGSLGLLLYTAVTLLPELQRLRARVRALESDQAYYAAPDPDEEPTEAPDETPPAQRGPSLFSRFRSHTTGELPADNYDDEPTHP
ncbi:hypothetical protein GO988_03315 [Hymenobacter sp. HMF4947]|uniref:Uncharacterized protein n=1 Tax=Hymenobacter ginkgonis TaxID=2682976 RepID=A0A7K1TAB6_9BACT|nr:hypothetical protein [Hymenobacter ginkgonis]MVN75347.1 hypothetical protein [Hymenobacter ginkgonis]